MTGTETPSAGFRLRAAIFASCFIGLLVGSALSTWQFGLYAGVATLNILACLTPEIGL